MAKNTDVYNQGITYQLVFMKEMTYSQYHIYNLINIEK